MADEKAHGEQNRQDGNQNQNQNHNQDKNQSQNQNQDQNLPPPVQPRRVLDAFSRLPSAGLIFLAFNTAVAVYRARDDPWLVAFVVLSFLDLLLLFYCLHLHETAPRNSPRRRHLRTAVWFLASFLTVMFSYRVAAMMPLPVAVLVWGAAALTVGLGFYWFFIYTPDGTAADTDSFLSVMFSYRVAAMMPLPIAVLVWAAAAGLIFLAFSSTAVAVYRARVYPWPVAFVVVSFLDLLLLFHFLRLLVAAPPNSNSNSPRRRCLTTAVWFLASFLTVMLSYGEADMKVAVVWCTAALAVGLGFYWFSIYTPDNYFLPTDLKDDDML